MTEESPDTGTDAADPRGDDGAVGRGEILWSPPDDVLTSSAAGRFAARHGFDDYADLHRWSITELDAFWRAVAEDCGVIWRRPPTDGVALADASMPGAVWFPGSALNYAEHALAPGRGCPDTVAVIGRSQSRPDVELTWRELTEQVARCAAGLRKLGVARGDRVAAYAPNVVETLVAFLATASLGAVWVSCAPEFGTRAVIERLGQVEPVVLLAVDGYVYGAKRIDRRSEVERLRAELPSVRHVIGLRHLGVGPDDWTPLLDVEPGTAAGAGVATAPEFEAVPFDHPLYVLFSSGTTGLPKAIVHGHGGITVEHLKALVLGQDLRRNDRFFWFSTTGWMMWNYLVSGLLAGSTIILFDGDPAAPDLSTLWRIAAETGCTIFGASAPFLMACAKAGVEPERGAIRWVGSTGAPLPADGFRWVHDVVAAPVSSLSGGTDICSGLVGSSPLVPVRAGEISCRLLGCAVVAVDEDDTICPSGVTGELVVTAPMPSMPVRFWNDPDGTRYRAAYFDERPGWWSHGDWITFTDDGACVISGRSDATLNRGGVRLGTSDFSACVEAFPEVVDSLVVHLEDGDRLLLFVQLASDTSLDDALRARINAALRTELSPRHTPEEIVAVPGVPRTISGKKLEVPVKRLLTGSTAATLVSRESIANPDVFEFYVEWAAAR